MRTARTRCLLIVVLALFALGETWAQGPYWYKLTLSARDPYGPVTIIFKVDDFITTDTWFEILPDGVKAYGQTWHWVYYGQSVDHSPNYLRLTRSNPPVDPSPNPTGVAFSIEAYFATPPNAVGTYTLDGLLDTTVWVTNGTSYNELHGPGSTLVITKYDPPLVRMAQMSATAGSRDVTLDWETASEIGTAGFLIRRAEQDGGPYQVVSDLIPAQGSPTQGAAYQWTDTNVVHGAQYYYLIEEVEDSGNTNTFGPINATLPPARRRR
ncbi:MAG: hypothetical protein ACE15E_17400 [Acidobacteriota bacterium]